MSAHSNPPDSAVLNIQNLITDPSLDDQEAEGVQLALRAVNSRLEAVLKSLESTSTNQVSSDCDDLLDIGYWHDL